MIKKRTRISEYGQSWAVAVTMLEGPKTLDEIISHFNVVKRRFGIFNNNINHNRAFFQETIKKLSRMGWLQKEEGRYRLTPEGKKEAEKAYNEVRESREKIRNNFFNPAAVSKVTLIIHFLLALIKLPIGIMSGSVGLLNDGVDTLLDGLSSTLVYYGIKYEKEKIVNIILITIMFTTGLFTLYQSIRRFFIPVENSIDTLTFIAVIFSALISLGLMIYQRYVGVKKNNFSLITQSVDSRNHLIVAGGVIVGMCASLLNYKIVDTLVGVVVAVLILKGAVELLLEVIKGEQDTSNYKMFNFSRRLFKKRLKFWLMRKIELKSLTRAELIAEGIKVLDFNKNITLESIGLNKCYNSKKMIKEVVAQLITEKYIYDEGKLGLTNKGKNKIKAVNIIFKKSCFVRYLLNYIIILPACVISFLLLYYISLAGLSYLPFTHLWQKIDIILFSISFPWINTVYKFTLMNLVHFIVGFGLYIYSVYHFINVIIENHNVRDPETRKPFKLITDGYYGKVRHPMYGMMILIYITFFFAHKSWLSLLVGILLAIILILNGWYEERYNLLPLFGNEYKEYRLAVENSYFDKITRVIIFLLVLIQFAGIIM